MKREGSPEEALSAFLAAHSLSLRANALVGYSGGPDSTALLLALVALGAGPIRAVHVDHGLRPEDERRLERELVKSVCARLRVPITIVSIRPGAVLRRAADLGEGVEASARKYRFHAFARVARNTGASLLYLAHTRDDQLETILMRMLSGAGAAGLRGMPERAGLIARPFLGIPKPDLLAYLAEKGASWSTDSTNASDAYARNRVRHRLVPFLQENFPGWESGLLLAARKAADDEAALGALAARTGFTRGADGMFRAPSALMAEPTAVRERAFLAAAGRLLGGRRCSSRLARAAFDALAGTFGAYEGGGLALEQSERGLVLRTALDFPLQGGYFVEIDELGPDGFALRIGGLAIEAAWQRRSGASGIRESAFSFPLIVRSRRPGDVLPIRGGRKPLDVLFSEWGLSSSVRDSVPVVEDRNGIVAVLGEVWGGRNRYRPMDGGEGDRLLSIEVKGA